MMNTDNDLIRAKTLLSRGYPLPVDLTARLLDAGVDVTALERRYCA